MSTNLWLNQDMAENGARELRRQLHWWCQPVAEHWPSTLWGIRIWEPTLAGFRDVYNSDQLSAVLGLPGYERALPQLQSPNPHTTAGQSVPGLMGCLAGEEMS